MRAFLSLRVLDRLARRCAAPARGGSRGQATIVLALAAGALFAIAGLAIEGGMVQMDRRFDQAVSDGAALAGAHQLPSADMAKKKAADFAVAGLNRGVIPAGCNPAPIESGGGLVPTACDPNPPHTLAVTTPYNSQSDEILVTLNHTDALAFLKLVGISSATTASRSVARGIAGQGPFPYAVYAASNITAIGNVNVLVNGNVYAMGCIEYNNSDTLTVGPQGSQPGIVQIYGQDSTTGSPVGPQVWDSGAGNGCTANVVGTGPNGWAAGGHTTATQSCAIPPQFGVNCPSYEQPVPLIPYPTGFNVVDRTGDDGVPCNTPGEVHSILNTGSGTVSGGCYSACAAGGGDLSIPSGTTFLPGTYAFYGSGANGCNVVFTGDAHNATTGGDGNGGVSFFLYNAAGMCASSCGASNGSGTLTFNAPTSGTNFGMLIDSCNGVCGNSSGTIWVKGPHWAVNWTGTVFNPGGDCIIAANAGEVVVGQVICNSVDVQGGAVSSGQGVTYGGSLLPKPFYLSMLIE